jgi:hypothetical protein
VCARRNVHALPGIGVPRGEHARTFDAGLREVFRQDWDSVCQSDVQEIRDGGIGANSECTCNGDCGVRLILASVQLY